MITTPINDDGLIRRLLPRHFKILDYTLAGLDTTAIAKTLNITAGSIRKIQTSPLFQAELTRRRTECKESEIISLDRQATLGKARSILEEATVAAAEKHIKLMDNIDPAIQMRAAAGILDRVFGKSNEGGASVVVNISAQHVELLNLALKESNVS